MRLESKARAVKWTVSRVRSLALVVALWSLVLFLVEPVRAQDPSLDRIGVVVAVGDTLITLKMNDGDMVARGDSGTVVRSVLLAGRTHDNAVATLRVDGIQGAIANCAIIAIEPGRTIQSGDRVTFGAPPPSRIRRTVVIESEPAGATVYMEHPRAEGTTPLEMELEGGRHLVTVELAGYRPKSVPLEIRAKGPSQFRIPLEQFADGMDPSPGPAEGPAQVCSSGCASAREWADSRPTGWLLVRCSHDCDVALGSEKAFRLSKGVPQLMTVRPGTLTVVATSIPRREPWIEVVAVESGRQTALKVEFTDGAGLASRELGTGRPWSGRALVNSAGMEFVRIPSGQFVMGSDSVGTDESPAHVVELTHDLWVGRHEVTQGQYEAVSGSNPSIFPGDPRRPVEGISWFEAIAFANQLSDRDGFQRCYGEDGLTIPERILDCSGYRLPTEAEWEYMARAGTQTQYSFGNSDSLIARFARFIGASRGTSDQGTQSVGMLEPNAWEIYDVHGNVSEWVHDFVDSYPAEKATDPSGPGEGTVRGIRGGGWYGTRGSLRSANRFGDVPEQRGSNLGFRLVRSAK